MTGNSAKKPQNGKIEDRAYELVKPFIEEKGYNLWDVCFEKEGAMWYLRILFDKEGGMDSDECEEISRPLNELIDKQDFIGNIDMLEIGTPGLSKKLRKPEHFKACTGERIRATVRDEKGKEVSVFGTLEAYDEEKNEITLVSEGETTVLHIPDCVKVNSDL
ncbi:MAG: ribosome maturation factor RimP [Ruminiclostridium sp.]|nr:ribosome maturation factor RimP [Ruminiclostridium sp.]